MQRHSEQKLNLTRIRLTFVVLHNDIADGDSARNKIRVKAVPAHAVTSTKKLSRVWLPSYFSTMDDAMEQASATTGPTMGAELMTMTAGFSHLSATSSILFMHFLRLSRTAVMVALLGLPASFFKPFATGSEHSTTLVNSAKVGKPA
jgi:hypothetical protein